MATNESATFGGGARSSLGAELSVLGGFTLIDRTNAAMAVSATTRRLLAYLAVSAREVGRITVAGMIWPDSTDERAAMSLRTALARMDAPTRELLHVASAR